ncbi:MAG: NDP-sugar synthase [Nitrososphaerota archaeon]
MVKFNSLQRYTVKAVVFAAGLGKRLRPLTNTRPKHLLPISGKPILRRILESLLLNGIEEVGIVVSYMPDLIIEDVKNYGLRMKVEWIHQKEPLGTGDALKVCEEFLCNEDYFIVVYGDITLNTVILGNMIRFFNENICDGVVEGVLVEDTLRFGRIISRYGRLEKIEEKTAGGPGLVNTGLYILPHDALEFSRQINLSRRGEYELTDVLNILVSRNYEILVHTTNQDWWMDIGSPRDYLKANIKKFIEEYGNRVICNSEVGEKVVVKPPSMILEEVEVERDTVIGPNTFIMKNVRIGSNTIIENSILLEGSIIGRSSVLRNVIIGEYVKIGDKVHVEGGQEVLVISPRTEIGDSSKISMV